jgi:hypothetical protein
MARLAQVRRAHTHAHTSSVTRAHTHGTSWTPQVVEIVNASIANSKSKLGMDPLHTVCLHQWAKHGPSLHGGAAYTRLKQLKAEGVSHSASVPAI